MNLLKMTIVAAACLTVAACSKSAEDSSPDQAAKKAYADLKEQADIVSSSPNRDQRQLCDARKSATGAALATHDSNEYQLAKAMEDVACAEFN